MFRKLFLRSSLHSLLTCYASNLRTLVAIRRLCHYFIPFLADLFILSSLRSYLNMFRKLFLRSSLHSLLTCYASNLRTLVVKRRLRHYFIPFLADLFILNSLRSYLNMFRKLFLRSSLHSLLTCYASNLRTLVVKRRLRHYFIPFLAHRKPRCGLGLRLYRAQLVAHTR